MVTRERGSDPASVCYATIERAEQLNSDLVLIDTAGRLHTSKDLMLELEKVCKVTRKRSNIPVYVILVIDATTGQNGLTQAKEFNDFLDLDALIVTKLDGTAKGGIALAISKELNLPILKIGVGEKIEDLRNFNADDFAKAFIGEEFVLEDEDIHEDVLDLASDEDTHESSVELKTEENVEDEIESEENEITIEEKEEEIIEDTEEEIEEEIIEETKEEVIEEAKEEVKEESKAKSLFQKLFFD